MKLLNMVAAFALVAVTTGGALASDDAARKELAPTGKLRVGIAVAPTPGAGNVAMDASGQPRGVGADLGRELAKKLGVPLEWVPYPNSGALTDAVTTGAWDVAFIPVDEQRKQKVDFGAPHLIFFAKHIPGGARLDHSESRTGGQARRAHCQRREYGDIARGPTLAEECHHE
jgi:polar amino acid transport system substrate-binding protein